MKTEDDAMYQKQPGVASGSRPLSRGVDLTVQNFDENHNWTSTKVIDIPKLYTESVQALYA